MEWKSFKTNTIKKCILILGEKLFVNSNSSVNKALYCVGEIFLSHKFSHQGTVMLFLETENVKVTVKAAVPLAGRLAFPKHHGS